MSRYGRAAAVGAFALALTACSSQGGAVTSGTVTSGTQSPTSGSASAPASAATSGPAASAPASPTAASADCSLDGIVPGRLGCLDTNLPVAGNPGEAAVAWDPDYCAPGDGRFVYSAAPTMVALAGQSGTAIGRIDVYDPTLTTGEGIHVGSTDAEVAAAYPENPAQLADPGTQLVVLSGEEGFVTIELANGWGADAWTVANIRVYAADQDPNVRVYGTEDFAGACPFDM